MFQVCIAYFNKRQGHQGRKDRMEGVGDGEIYCSYRARDVEDVSEFARWKNLTHLKY